MFKPKQAIVFLVLLAVGSAIAFAEKGVDKWVHCRVMTYNVGCAANLPLGPRQIGQIAETIIDNQVDVAGITELEEGTIWHDGRDLVAELCIALDERGYPMHMYTWRQMRIAGGWFTPALLSRYAIEESGYEVIEPPAGSRWCVGYVTVKVAAGTPIRVHMTHIWPHGDPQDLAKAVGKVASVVNQWQGPQVLMGDFNLTPPTPLYKAITDHGWRSSCQVLHGAPCPTVQGIAGIAGPLPLKQQIDYIFGNNRVDFVDTYVGYFSMSDHWPVFAEVRVKAKGPSAHKNPPARRPHSSKSQRARAKAAERYRRHDYTKAVRSYRDWEKNCDNSDHAGFAAYSAGNMYLLAGDSSKAVRMFRRVIRSYANTEWSTRAYYRLAFIHKESRKWRLAEKEFMAFLEGYYRWIHPDDPKVPTVKCVAEEIAACRLARGVRTDTEAVLTEFSQGDDKSIIARSAKYQIGHKKLMAGDLKGALPYFLQAAPVPKGMHHDGAKRTAKMYREAGRKDLAKPFEHYCAQWNRR